MRTSPDVKVEPWVSMTRGPTGSVESSSNRSYSSWLWQAPNASEPIVVDSSYTESYEDESLQYVFSSIANPPRIT